MRKRAIYDCTTYTKEELERYTKRLSLKRRKNKTISNENTKANIPTEWELYSANSPYSNAKKQDENSMPDCWQIRIRLSQPEQQGNLLVSISVGDLQEPHSFLVNSSITQSELYELSNMIVQTLTQWLNIHTISFVDTALITGVTKSLSMALHHHLSERSKDPSAKIPNIYDSFHLPKNQKQIQST